MGAVIIISWWVNTQVIAVDSSSESGGSYARFLAFLRLRHLEGQTKGETGQSEGGFHPLSPDGPSVDGPSENRFFHPLSPDGPSVDGPSENRFFHPLSPDRPSVDRQPARGIGEPFAQSETSGVRLPLRRTPKERSGVPPLPSGLDTPEQAREDDRGRGGAGPGRSLPPLVEQPREWEITGGRDVYVAGHDIIQTIVSRSLTPEGRDATVVDEHESLYKVRPFDLGPESLSGAGFLSGGVVSSGGGSSVSQRDLARTRPALMLGGHAAVTTFVGRTTALADLKAWYERPESVSAMLVHGALGQGKTRLTREFVSRVALWDARVIVRETIALTEVSPRLIASQDGSADHRDGAEPTHLLLLVDEADLWPAHKLRKLLRDMAATSYRQIRLLLTGRAAADWWSALEASLSPLDVRWHDLLLQTPDPAEMRELAIAAASSYAARLGWDEPPALPEELWRQLDGCPALSVELMVLARMHAAEAGRSLPGTLREAVEVALHKELRCWEHMHGTTDPFPGSADYRIQLDPRAMRRAVYAATLTGPLGETTARRVVDLAGLGCALDSQQVIDDHARCYPAADSQYLAPLPTCLAEEFLGLLVPDPARPSGTPLRDRWAVTAPFHILGLLDPRECEEEEAARDSAARAGMAPDPPTPGYYPGITFGPQRKPLVLRLVRASATWPHLAERQLYPLAERYPQVLVRTEGVWSELLNIPAQPSDKALAALGQAADEVLARDSQEWLTAKDTLRKLAERKNPPGANG
jgi:hypothetical protein